jgi:hypothetical protein
VLSNRRLALVLFYSQICRLCMMMEALVQMVRSDFEPTVVFIEVRSDLASNAGLVARMDVGTLPAFFFIMPSGESKRVTGVMNQQGLCAELARLLESAQTVAPTPSGSASPRTRGNRAVGYSSTGRRLHGE